MTNFPVQPFYPNFVANQLLTNTQLNQLRDFLFGQVRQTRVRLAGMGIVCGLTVRLEAGEEEDAWVVVISEGYGLTSDGYLIEIPETRLLNIRSYTDPLTVPSGEGYDLPAYEPWRLPAGEIDTSADPVVTQIPLQELLSETTLQDPAFAEEEDNVSQAITEGDLTDKVLCLYLEMQGKNLKSCLTTDCNNKGQNLHLRVKALLVDKDRLSPLGPCAEAGTTIDIPRLHHGLGKTAGIGLPEVDNATQINEAYRDIAGHLKDKLITGSGAGAGGLLVDAFSQYRPYLDIARLEARVRALGTALDAVLADPGFNQYHYDFFKDLITAYNEFTQLVCTLIKDCCPEGDFPRHLMLKCVDPEDAGADEYRHRFRPSPVRNVLHEDLEKAEKLFARILTIGEHFALPGEAAVKITPSQTEAHPLGKRTIPYYYEMNSIATFWPPRDCCTPPPLSYADNQMNPPAGDYLSNPGNPLTLNINPYSLLRIEGHYGQPCEAVLEQLAQLRRQHNLEFAIRILHLGEAGGISPWEDPLITEIRERLQKIADIWNNLFELARTGQLTPDILNERLQEIDSIQKELAETNSAWCRKRQEKPLPCDISFLQTEYLQLRGELQCLTHKILPLLGRFPKFPAVQELCLTFNSLTAGTRFGSKSNGQDDRPGQVVFNEQGVPVSVENFLLSNGNTTFNFAQVTAGSETNNYINFNNINLRFDFRELGFEVTEVTILVADFGGSENIAVNDERLLSGDIKDAFGGRPIAEGVTMTFSPTGNNTGTVTLNGRIRSLTIGGQEFLLDNLCVKGSGNQSPGQENSELSIRARRLENLLRFFPVAFPMEVTCLNPAMAASFLQDLSNTAIQIKLLYRLVFKAIGEAPLAYSNFPYWDDLLQALHRLQCNCLRPQLLTVYYTLEAIWNGSAFQHFATHHPGMEHLAGVEPGGAFLLVCEPGEAANNGPVVVADFALRHGGCCCAIDPEDLCLPPIALPDYSIIDIVEKPEDAFFDIGLNDFSLNDRPLTFKLPESLSALGVKLSLEDTGNAPRPVIRYQLSSYSPVENLYNRIDHVTYTVEDPACNRRDTGHLWILITGERQPSPGIVVVRGNEYVNAYAKLQGVAVLQDSNAFAEAGNFVENAMQMPLEEANKIYPATAKALIKDYSEAKKKDQKYYRQTLELLTRAYLDRVVIDNPESLNPESGEILKSITRSMTAVDISPRGIKNAWKGKELEKELDARVITQINGLLE